MTLNCSLMILYALKLLMHKLWSAVNWGRSVTCIPLFLPGRPGALILKPIHMWSLC